MPRDQPREQQRVKSDMDLLKMIAFKLYLIVDLVFTPALQLFSSLPRYDIILYFKVIYCFFRTTYPMLPRIVEQRG